MSETTFKFYAGVGRERQIQRICAFLCALAPDRGWTIEVKELKRKRSLSQNALLWAIYGQIIANGGEAMAGWTKDDLHDFFLIEHFGGERKQLFGRYRIVPHSRSSKLDKQAFADFVDHIVRFMAERGVYIEMPDDVRQERAA